jgi:hypothetical protein
MKNTIQTQVLDLQNGTVYWERQFSNISMHQISYQDYQRIQKMVEYEVEKCSQVQSINCNS